MDVSQVFTQVGHIGAGFLDGRSWSSLRLVSRGTNIYCESSKQFQSLKIPLTLQSKDWDQAAFKHKGPIEVVICIDSSSNISETFLEEISKLSGSLQGLHISEFFYRNSQVTLVNDLLTRGLHKVCPNLRKLTLPIPIRTDSTTKTEIAAQLRALNNLEDLCLYTARSLSLPSTLASADHDTRSCDLAFPALRNLSLGHEQECVMSSCHVLEGALTLPMMLVNSKTSLVTLDLKWVCLSARELLELGQELEHFRNLETLALNLGELNATSNDGKVATRALIDGLRDGHLPKTLRTLDLKLLSPSRNCFDRAADVLIDSIPFLAALQILVFVVDIDRPIPKGSYRRQALVEVIQKSQLRSITWEFEGNLRMFRGGDSGEGFFNWFIPQSPKFYTAFTSRLKSLTIGGLVFHGFPLNGMTKLAFSRLEAIETLRLQKCGGCFESLVEAVQAIPHKDRVSEFSLFNFQFDSSMQSFSLLPARRLHSMPSTYGARVYAAQRQIRSILPVVKAMTSLSRLTLWIGYIMTFEVMNLLGPGLDLVEFAEELRAVFLRLEYLKVSFGAPCYVIESQLSQPPSAPASLMQVREKTET